MFHLPEQQIYLNARIEMMIAFKQYDKCTMNVTCSFSTKNGSRNEKISLFLYDFDKIGYQKMQFLKKTKPA